MKKKSDPKKARASKKTADAVQKPRDNPQTTDWVRWLREHQLPPGTVLPEPEAVNHELLVVMREMADALALGPCALEQHGCLSRQHQRKLAPQPPGDKETHISLVCCLRWLLPWRVHPADLLSELLRRLLPL